MNSDATLCGGCGRFSKPIFVAVSRPDKLAVLDRLNLAIARWETGSTLANRVKNGIDLPKPKKAELVRQVVGVGAVVLGIGLLVLWLGPEANFLAARYGVGSMVAGFGLLFFDRLIKPALDLRQSGTAPLLLPAIRFLERDTNVLAVQLLTMAYLIERAWLLQVSDARAAAVVVVAAAALLYPTRMRLISLLLGFAATAYVIVITVLLTNYSFRAGTDDPGADFVVPLWPVFWIVASVAAFPQLQLIRWGRFRVGAVRGDIFIRLQGQPVLLAFGSAVLIAALLTTVVAVLHSPFWIGVITN